ncbi:hypothetical protein HMPREF9016_00233 [Neisseria sp. oral taxon 014 str. F0314]|uniref:hypothetical protein n=1 Tax=Neisseria sp. oral taxon 014 TaxID=641148 RepID=UPI0001D8C13D|nr:hypothetical protein [Neisseria sp. oral taxon 014]EFI24057.1 hypothetical protein HMPREF9016_00233 [Neisseria sp. oral taxon 014 str. F0314]
MKNILFVNVFGLCYLGLVPASDAWSNPFTDIIVKQAKGEAEKAQKGNSDDGGVTAGIFTGGSQVNAAATASGKGSKAMAGGVVSSTTNNKKNAKGVSATADFSNARIDATATASGGKSAYAGGRVITPRE